MPTALAAKRPLFSISEIGLNSNIYENWNEQLYQSIIIYGRYILAVLAGFGTDSGHG
jgi:hypothetical protein